MFERFMVMGSKKNKSKRKNSEQSQLSQPPEEIRSKSNSIASHNTSRDFKNTSSNIQQQNSHFSKNSMNSSTFSINSDDFSSQLKASKFQEKQAKQLKKNIPKFYKGLLTIINQENQNMEGCQPIDIQPKLQNFLIKNTEFIDYIVNICLFPYQYNEFITSEVDITVDEKKHIAYLISESFKIGFNKNIIKYFFKNKSALFLRVLEFLEVDVLDFPTAAYYFNNILLNIQKVKTDEFWSYISKNTQEFVQLFKNHMDNQSICSYISYLLKDPKTNDTSKNLKDEIMISLLQQIFTVCNDDCEKLWNISLIIIDMLTCFNLNKTAVQQELAKTYLYYPCYMDQLFIKLDLTKCSHNCSYIVSIINYTYVFYYNQMGSQLIEYIPRLLKKLWDEESQETNKIQQQYGGYIEPVGPGRLIILELFENFLRGCNEQIMQALADSDFIPVLLKLIIKYEWNNILHSQIEKLLVLIINSQCLQMVNSLFITHKFLDYIIDKFKKNNIRMFPDNKNYQQKNKAYIGYLLSITFEIKNSRNKLVTQFTRKHPQWQHFINKKISQQERLWKDYQTGTALCEQDHLEDLSEKFDFQFSFSPQDSGIRSLKNENSSQFEIIVDEEEEEIKQEFQKSVLDGCGNDGCSNQHCSSNPENQNIQDKQSHLNKLMDKQEYRSYQRCDLKIRREPSKSANTFEYIQQQVIQEEIKGEQEHLLKFKQAFQEQVTQQKNHSKLRESEPLNSHKTSLIFNSQFRYSDDYINFNSTHSLDKIQDVENSDSEDDNSSKFKKQKKQQLDFPQFQKQCLEINSDSLSSDAPTQDIEKIDLNVFQNYNQNGSLDMDSICTQNDSNQQQDQQQPKTNVINVQEDFQVIN